MPGTPEGNVGSDTIRSLPKFNLKTILSDPPKLHDYGGRVISDWRIDDTTCFELNSRLKAGLNHFTVRVNESNLGLYSVGRLRERVR
jgi:hypothetical protein